MGSIEINILLTYHVIYLSVCLTPEKLKKKTIYELPTSMLKKKVLTMHI